MVSVIQRAGRVGVVLAAVCCWGCGAGTWKAPPINDEFLVAAPVPGAKQPDPTTAFDDDDDDAEPETSAKPDASPEPETSAEPAETPATNAGPAPAQNAPPAPSDTAAQSGGTK